MFTIIVSLMDIITVGVGILGVIGLSVAGIQYLSNDDTKAIKKNKRNLFEIITGLAAYATIFAIIKWILPT